MTKAEQHPHQRLPSGTERWVSFSELKGRVSIADILGYYGLLDKLKPQRGGKGLVGLCPFHQERRGSFHASLSKNAWHCFGCGRHGNILDFVAAKEGTDIRQAGLLIQGWFGSAPQNAPEAPQRPEKPQGATLIPSGFENPENKPVVSLPNPPLTFELKNLDAEHPYLKERGLTKKTVEHFGLGYYSGRGLMKGRIAIPIHNERGELVAYAGRWPGEPPEAGTGQYLPEDTERYLMPSGFQKSHVVFNLNRASELAREEGLVVVVEGFFSVFRMHQAGFSNAVALMGSSLSESQRELLVGTVGTNGRITLMLDGDDAGRACQEQCLRELSRYLFVKVVELPEGGQPDQLGEDEIRQFLSS